MNKKESYLTASSASPPRPWGNTVTHASFPTGTQDREQTLHARNSGRRVRLKSCDLRDDAVDAAAWNFGDPIEDQLVIPDANPGGLWGQRYRAAGRQDRARSGKRERPGVLAGHMRDEMDVVVLLTNIGRVFAVAAESVELRLHRREKFALADSVEPSALEPEPIMHERRHSGEIGPIQSLAIPQEHIARAHDSSPSLAFSASSPPRPSASP